MPIGTVAQSGCIIGVRPSTSTVSETGRLRAQPGGDSYIGNIKIEPKNAKVKAALVTASRFDGAMYASVKGKIVTVDGHKVIKATSVTGAKPMKNVEPTFVGAERCGPGSIGIVAKVDGKDLKIKPMNAEVSQRLSRMTTGIPAGAHFFGFVKGKTMEVWDISTRVIEPRPATWQRSVIGRSPDRFTLE